MTETNGWVTGIYPGKETAVIKTKNATIEISRPIEQPPEERARIEARIIEAMKALGKELKK